LTSNPSISGQLEILNPDFLVGQFFPACFRLRFFGQKPSHTFSQYLLYILVQYEGDIGQKYGRVFAEKFASGNKPEKFDRPKN
jgi:hypothetical protein